MEQKTTPGTSRISFLQPCDHVGDNAMEGTRLVRFPGRQLKGWQLSLESPFLFQPFFATQLANICNGWSPGSHLASRGDFGAGSHELKLWSRMREPASPVSLWGCHAVSGQILDTASLRDREISCRDALYYTQ